MSRRKPRIEQALEPEEIEILEAYQEGRLERVPGSSPIIGRLESAARATLRKDKRINIRLPGHELIEL